MTNSADPDQLASPQGTAYQGPAGPGLNKTEPSLSLLLQTYHGKQYRHQSDTMFSRT